MNFREKGLKEDTNKLTMGKLLLCRGTEAHVQGSSSLKPMSFYSVVIYCTLGSQTCLAIDTQLTGKSVAIKFALYGFGKRQPCQHQVGIRDLIFKSIELESCRSCIYESSFCNITRTRTHHVYSKTANYLRRKCSSSERPICCRLRQC